MAAYGIDVIDLDEASQSASALADAMHHALAMAASVTAASRPAGLALLVYLQDESLRAYNADDQLAAQVLQMLAMCIPGVLAGAQVTAAPDDPTLN